MSFINWGNETPEQREFRRRMEEREFLQIAFVKKLFEARGATSSASSAAGAGGGGNSGPTPGLKVGNAYTAIYAPDQGTGGNYSIWIVNPENETQEYLIDTGWPTGDNYDIIPTQNGGSMYILKQGFGAAASYNYKLLYYQIDGTLIFEETFTNVLQDFWGSLGPKGGYVMLDNNLILFFEDQVTMMSLGFDTDIYEFNITNYTLDGSILINYGSGGQMGLRHYNINGNSSLIGDFPDFSLIAFSAYESTDYYGSDAEVTGDTIIMISNDRTIFRLINNDGSARVNLRQQIIDDYSFDVADSDYLGNVYTFGSASINPTDIANIRFSITFYSGSISNMFLINGDTGCYYGIEAEAQLEVSQDYYNTLSNSFAFYLPATLTDSSPVEVRGGFQKPQNGAGYNLYFVNSIGDTGYHNFPTRLNGSGSYILIEDETGEYVLWPYINLIAKIPNPLYQYKLHRLNGDNTGTENTFNDLTADEFTSDLVIQAAISKNGYKKVTISFNKSEDSLLWHVVNPNFSLQLVNVLESVPADRNPYGYSYMPPLASGGPFVIPYGYGQGSEAGLCIFDINNATDPEGVTVATTTGMIMPTDTTQISTVYLTGTKSNASNNGCFVFMQEGQTEGNSYNFCFVDNDGNVYEDSFYKQLNQSFQLFPGVLYVGKGEYLTEVRSTVDYSLIKEITERIDSNVTSLIFGYSIDDTMLRILTKEGNISTFNLPPFNYSYRRMVNDIDWYND
jgi:hypothetical protein